MLAEVLLGLALIPLVWSQFLVPGEGPRLDWKGGEVQEISYNTTCTEYTIALWQQSLSGGFAILGPILFRKLHSSPCLLMSMLGFSEADLLPRRN